MIFKLCDVIDGFSPSRLEVRSMFLSYCCGCGWLREFGVCYSAVSDSVRPKGGRLVSGKWKESVFIKGKEMSLVRVISLVVCAHS